MPTLARNVVGLLARRRPTIRIRGPHAIPRACGLHCTATLLSTDDAHPFSFLPANSLEPKADRNKGLTEIRGPYYAPVTKTYLDELLKDWGEYVDGVKFAGGAFSLMPEDRLRALIDVAHFHGERYCAIDKPRSQ